MLSAEQIEKLRPMLQTSGWREVVVPLLEARKKRMQEIAFLLPSERPEPYRGLDDQVATSLMRGEVKCCEWLMHAFTNEVMVRDLNEQRDQERLVAT